MKYAFMHCNIIDGTKTAEIQRDMTILVEDDKITAIQPTSNEPILDHVTFDLSGKYVLPGLINMHVHLFGSGKPSKVLGGSGDGLQQFIINFTATKLGRKVLQSIIASNLQNSLHAGITTIRAVGDFHYCDVAVRDQINAGEIEGPRLFVSGPAITVTNGHGEGTFGQTADGPWALRKLVRENVKHGVDLIKICVTGGVMDSRKKGEAGALRMTLEEAAAICDEAHKNGFKVASHTESVAGVKVDLLAGVDTIEHGSQLDDEMVALCKKNGAALICTISPALPLALLSSEQTKLSETARFNSQIILDGVIDGAKTALANDIPVGLGTDSSCPFVTQYDMWREMVYFKHYTGVSNAFAIFSATLQNAAILGIDDLTGSIEAGKCADLIVVEEDPLADLCALRDVKMIMHQGKLVDTPHVKRSQMVDETLDGLLKELC